MALLCVLVSVIYILQISNVALYLEDYIMDEQILSLRGDPKRREANASGKHYLPMRHSRPP